MADHKCPDHRREERIKMAGIVCLFLTLLIFIILIILYFSVFKPKDPSVLIPMMQIVSYSAVGTPSSLTSVQLGLALQVYVGNSNRGVFHIEDSSTATMFYGNTQVAISSLPLAISTTPIASQSFLTFGVTIRMQSPISLNLTALYSDPSVGALPLPVLTVVTLAGHVKTAGLISHHSIVVSTCNVNIALTQPRTFIQSYVCERSHPLSD